MCEYCSGERSIMNLVVETFKKENVFFNIIGNWIYLIRKDGTININTRWRINYCPMCGTRLEDK